MSRFSNFLQKIRETPAFYIGSKDICALAHLLSGYELAIYDITGENLSFHKKFQRFVEHKNIGKYLTTIDWSGFLLEGRSPEEAFDLFFVYWDDFVKMYPNWETIDYTMVTWEPPFLQDGSLRQAP